MNGIVFVKESGGIVRSIAGEDHISGFVAYIADAQLPAGFTTADRIKEIGTIESAEALGIVSTSENWLVKVLHYHISKAFSINPNASIFLGLFTTPVTTYDFTELKTVQNYAEGRIRQAAIYAPDKEFAAGDITAIKAVCTTLESEHMPLSVLYAATIANVTGIETIAATGQKRVSLVVGQDGSDLGSQLYEASAAGEDPKKSVTEVGLALGAVSLAAVNESIGWIEKFPAGINTPALCDGTLIKEMDQATLTTLDGKRVLFLRKHGGIAGSYFNDSHNLDLATYDEAYIENVRTMDKATRGMRTYLLPKLSSPLTVDTATGLLDSLTVSNLELIAKKALEDMEKSAELSGYSCEIDNTTNVLETGEVVFVVKKVDIGVARNFKVKISNVTNI
ncbi:MAG: DUF2586 family protein [Bacteroidales bacterium]|nr:DUF2586 family protein [Bacteroidales bacterium]